MEVRQKLKLLPEKSGVYLMKDINGEIIYVGKAKILKNRVRSYFTGSHDAKTQKLVSLIADFEYIITGSEVEALILECNLIKKYNPKFNILLRDDKSYPYLMITDEVHPRILVTRQIKKGQGKLFGPYPNATAAKEAVDLLNRLFPFRKCRQIPSRPCLYLHLEQCLGPCINKINFSDYETIRKDVTNFLRGDQKKIIQILEGKMLQASNTLEFERAKEYRDLIQDLRHLGEKQNITLNDFIDRDVIGYSVSTDQMSIQIFHLRQGKLLTRDSFLFPYFEEPEEAFISFLVQFYTENSIWPEEILIPPINNKAINKLLPIMIPQRGKKKELVLLAISNAQTFLHEQIFIEIREQSEINNALEKLGECLQISYPINIEAFDISNTGGTNIVAGMVKFIEGKPDRNSYRKFKLETMEKNDDTAAINQVIYRRYSKLVLEKSPLPNLILVDGGKGQIKAAIKALEELKLYIPVAGMVKNDKHQTAGLLDPFGYIIPLESNSNVFHLIERIQSEVHRFAISFHRQQRAKFMTLSVLDKIPGIGPKRRQILLKFFKSINKIKEASIQDLINAGLTEKAALAVYNYFQKEQN